MISQTKTWVDARVVVSVTYLGFYNDGTQMGVEQTCILPWDGSTETSASDLVAAAQVYFDAKFGVGSDRVLSADLHDRGPKAAIGADAVEQLFQ